MSTVLYETVKRNTIQEAEEKLAILYRLRDTTFSHQALQQQKTLSEEIVSMLPKNVDKTTILENENDISGKTVNAEMKAKLLYIKGKALDVFAEHSAEAELVLSRAVKLSPSFVDAWNALGHCYWKKKDLSMAKQCFETALKLKNNKVSLRELSRVLRIFFQSKTSSQQSAEAEFNAQVESIKSSVQMAKSAVALDVTDGESWYVMGNAYLSLYLTLMDYDDLNNSLKAYTQAEKTESFAENPDLHYNRSIIYKFLEEYELAFKGFEKAFKIDTSLQVAKQQAEVVGSMVQEIQDAFLNKVAIKKKVLPKYSAKILKSKLSSLEYKEQSLSKLPTNGSVNINSAVTLCVVRVLSQPSAIPLTLFGMDEEGEICIVSVYNVQFSAVKEGDAITIVMPAVTQKSISITYKSANISCQYPHIFVKVPAQIFVNKSPLNQDKITAPSMKVSFFC